MERNEFNNENETRAASTVDATETENFTAGSENTTFESSAPSSAEDTRGVKDKAKNVASKTGDKLASAGSAAREKVGVARDKLVTALEVGADKLRTRSQGGSLAAAGAEGSTTAVQADGRMAQVSDKVAGGMQASADWLRDADLDGLKTGIEQQVKEHPGRTLLIAAGLGYLIGRAFRGGNQ